jgi:alkaline phosphatase
VYDSVTLKRVAFISDNYSNYVSKEDSTSRIQQLVTKVHGMGKLLRLWGIPDNAASWQRLQQLGVDIINTDKVEECRKYFMKR